MSLFEKLGDVDSKQVICLVLALLTFGIPWLVGLLWLAAAFLPSFGFFKRANQMVSVVLKQAVSQVPEKTEDTVTKKEEPAQPPA